MQKLAIPENALTLIVGASGSGKTTWARARFQASQVLSSDNFRRMVADDEGDQEATADAFQALHLIVAKRLERNRLTVVDATNLHASARLKLLKIAKRFHVQTVAVALDMPEDACLAHNGQRPERSVPAAVVKEHCREMKIALKRMDNEGFWRIYRLTSPEQAAAVEIDIQRLPPNLTVERGPFDLIGDVHGCCDELVELLDRLGYVWSEGDGGPMAVHPEGRRAVFLGDLVDRGPQSPAVLRLAIAMTRGGSALCLPGNHDAKLVRKLLGHDVKVRYGLQETLDQLAAEPESFRREIVDFFQNLPTHAVLDQGRLVAAHAGMLERLQGRVSKRTAAFALYGQTTGETDAFGLPVRYDWARDYRGKALVVYGHTPVIEPEWTNNTICIDTGCVFGGKLTALRYPERALVQVPAKKEHYQPLRPQ